MKNPMLVLAVAAVAATGLVGCAESTPETTTPTTGASNAPAVDPTAPPESDASGKIDPTSPPKASVNSDATSPIVDPNKVDAAAISKALKETGIDNTDALAKAIKDGGPYTADNMRDKITTVLTEAKLKVEDIPKALSVLRVG